MNGSARVLPLWVYRVLYDPFEAWVAVAALLAGFTALFPVQSIAPVAITTSLPIELQRAWGVAALAGGIPCVIGVLYGSVRLRYIGLTLIGPALASVALTNLYANYPSGLYGTLLSVGLSAACWTKMYELHRALDRTDPHDSQ